MVPCIAPPPNGVLIEEGGALPNMVLVRNVTPVVAKIAQFSEPYEHTLYSNVRVSEAWDWLDLHWTGNLTINPCHQL